MWAKRYQESRGHGIPDSNLYTRYNFHVEHLKKQQSEMKMFVRTQEENGMPKIYRCGFFFNTLPSIPLSFGIAKLQCMLQDQKYDS